MITLINKRKLFFINIFSFYLKPFLELQVVTERDHKWLSFLKASLILLNIFLYMFF